MTPRRARIVRIAAIIAAPLALFVALATWSLSSPVASSADEDFHLASIWCGTGFREGLCERGSDDDHRQVPLQLIEASRCFDNKPEQAASCPAYPSNVLTDTDRGNFAGIYPPVFYTVMGLFASENISVSVIAMRLLNAGLYVAVVTSVFLLIPHRRRGVMVWGTLATIVPFGMFLIPSVNPSSWGVICASTLWLAVLGYFEADSSRRRVALAAIAALAVLLGAGSRADAAAYAAVSILIVGMLKAQRTREFVRLAIFPSVLVAVTALSFLTSGQANAINPGVEVTIPDGEAPQGWWNLLWYNLLHLPELWAGAFGGPVAGRALWLGTTVPGIIWAPAIIAFGGVLFLGLRRIDARKALSMLAITGLLVMLPLLWLMRDEIIVGQGVQARYLYPLMIVLAGVSLLGFGRSNAGLGRTHMILVATAAVLGNIAIQWTTIRRFVTGLDAKWFNLDLNLEWWWGLPIGPMPLWVLGSIAFAVFCALCVAFGWRRGDKGLVAEAGFEPATSRL